MNKDSILGRHLECKTVVENILSTDEKTRNNDLWLLLQTWKRQGAKIDIDFEFFSTLYQGESITRVRRQIQNDECRLLPTDPAVLVKRRFKEEVIRQYYANNQTILREYDTIRYGIK